MKNKRNKIVDFFKIGVILFGISLFLWNCEKDEILLQEQKKEIEGKYINLLELQKTNKEVSSKIEKFVNENNRSSKSIINTNYGFSINTSKILQIEEKDYISFTFEAYKDVINEKDLYNFVLEKHIDGSFNQYLLSYPINTKGFIEVDLAKIEVIKSPELLLKGCEVKEVATIEEDTSSCVYLQCTGGGNHLYGQECDAPSNMQPQKICSLTTIQTTQTECDSSTGGTGGSTTTTDPIGTSSNNTTNTETTSETVTAPVYLLPKGFSLYLTIEEKRWLYAEENEEERNKIAFFLDTNKNSDNTYPEEAITFAKGQIELGTIADKFSETDPIKIKLSYKPGRINERDEQKYTHIGTDGIRTYYKMNDGSTVIASLDQLQLNSNGSLASKFTSEANNTSYYYIKPFGASEWSNYLVKEQINTVDELETLFKLAGLELGKTLGRYVLPIEDIKILIDGKDFDGQDVARWQAAGGILLTVVPGGKVVGAGAKVLKPIIKVTKETNVWRVVIKNGSKTYTRIVRELTEETLAHFDRYAPGTKELIDEALRTGKYVDTTINDAAEIVADISTKKGRTLTWDEVKALFKRGKDFNLKAEDIYEFNEIVLSTGKRLDSYIPNIAIISRKATTLSNIKPEIFKRYLQELITKYPKGTAINAPKYGTTFKGQVLKGDYFLEIPLSNKTFFENSAIFQKVLSDFNSANNVIVKIKYFAE